MGLNGDAIPMIFKHPILLGFVMFLLSNILVTYIDRDRPRDVAGTPITNLCEAYAKWKRLAGPKIAEPDPAPNLTERCVEGP